MGKTTKNITFYILMIAIFGSLMYFVAKEGESRQLADAVIMNVEATEHDG